MFQRQADGRLKFSIRVTVVGMFLLMTAVTVAVALGLQYYFSTRLATQSALGDYRQAAADTRDYLDTVDKRATDATRLLAAYPGLVTEDGHVSPRARTLFTRALASNPLFYAAYIGLPNGRFYELVNLDSSPTVRRHLKALPQDRWVVITVTGRGTERQRRFRYYDADFRLRASRSEPTDYRPQERPWYVQAEAGKVHKTAPYLFQHLQAPGQTYATRLPGGNGVMAVDIALASLSAELAERPLSGDSRLYLFQDSGELIASSERRRTPVALPAVEPLTLTPAEKQVVADNPVLTVSNETDWPPFDFAVSGEPRGYAIDVLTLVSRMTGLRFRYFNGRDWPAMRDMFRDGQLDIIHPVLGTETNAELGRMSDAFIRKPFGVLTRKGAEPVTRIEQLVGKRVAIPEGWSMIEPLRRELPDVRVVEVADVRAMFDAVRAGRVHAGVDIAAFLRYNARKFFLDDVTVHAPLDLGDAAIPTGLHFIVHPQREGVVELLDLALARIDARHREVLDARWLPDPAGAAPKRGSVPHEALVDLAADPAALDRLHTVSLGGQPHFVYLAALEQTPGTRDFFAVVTPRDSVLAPAVAKVTTATAVTGGILLLCLPLASWLAGFIVRPIKNLADENRKIQQRRYRELAPPDSRIVEIDELSTSLLAMARSIEAHSREQEALMDAFIRVIAQAIDDKSPHTGGHCERVPELALMLAEKAENSERPPFDGFRFAGEQEWREFRIGAWLHDCGKITTPEHVMDKGTKLEASHNRIHEIRTRFEVLWRDAEIDYWQRRHAGAETEEALATELARRRQRLRDDFAFVAACNVGGEFLDGDARARLERLARTTWQRHFDDRLGLSPGERRRFPGGEAELPVTETLLADKPWHLIERTRDREFAPHLGIRMSVPEHLYNHGELHNLTISRGTLTPEERFKVQAHMISTIKMLDALPLPTELARVPRYASTHHETLDGRGYPRGLTGDDLSTPERIMVLADIFEALTASDRPYKEAKSLSTAIDILYRMVQDNHVDRDVFELFLTSGAYRDYADRHLAPSQIDDVDINRYLR